MKQALRVLALAVLLGSAGYWMVSGASRGWSKTSVPKKTLDPVTGIEGVTYERKFVPGLDFLALTVAAAGVFAGASFLFRAKKAGNSTAHLAEHTHP